jgi:Tfp pilus assembly protein PilO
MKGYWESLRPFEKRVVMAAGVLFFIVLNAWLVWPHFSDMGQVKFRMQVAKDKLGKYQAEIAQTPTYLKKVRELEGQGLAVPAEDQALQFVNAVNAQAGQSGVRFLGTPGRIITVTNQFFIEKSQNFSVQGGEKQMVDFLYTLGSGESLIRVRDLGIRAEPAHHELVGTVKLVASYQKKTPTRPGATPGTRTAATPPPMALAENGSSTTK